MRFVNHSLQSYFKNIFFFFRYCFVWMPILHKYCTYYLLYYYLKMFKWWRYFYSKDTYLKHKSRQHLLPKPLIIVIIVSPRDEELNLTINGLVIIWKLNYLYLNTVWYVFVYHNRNTMTSVIVYEFAIGSSRRHFLFIYSH